MTSDFAPLSQKQPQPPQEAGRHLLRLYEALGRPGRQGQIISTGHAGSQIPRDSQIRSSKALRNGLSSSVFMKCRILTRTFTSAFFFWNVSKASTTEVRLISLLQALKVRLFCSRVHLLSMCLPATPERACLNQMLSLVSRRR